MEWLYDYISFPITDPTWIFLLVLVIILFAPIVLDKLRIPHIIGMIIAGVLVGEHGLNILARDSSFELFGKVGLFSPVRMKEEQFEIHKRGKEACVPCVESQPVYFVCIGKKDYFYLDGKRFIKRLKNAGLTCEEYETDSGHTWRSWREYLVAFIETL